MKQFFYSLLFLGVSFGTTAQTVVDIIVNSEDHNTLEAAVLAAGLEGVLSGDGPFTVFAPTDAAFEALPAGTVDALLADIPALTAILTYHVVGAAAFSGDLSDGQVIATLNGADVTVSLDGGVFINNAQVIIADIAASNGVVHVIDAVLLPPAPITVVDIIVNSEVHNTLEAAVLAAGLEGVLAGEGPFTVFAPTDAAFAALPAGTVEALLADIPTLTAILTYHVVGAAAFSGDLSDGQVIATLNGADVTVSLDGGVFINDAQVILADIEASNGVVHVIDAVLLPPAPITVVDIIVNSEVHNILEAAVLAAGLEGVLAGEGPFTVFAPTDAAFEALPAGTVDALLADIPTLTAILTYHVVGAAAFSGDLSDGQVIATLNGADVTVSLDGGVFINDAQVILADIAASNGVVHVIDAVLLPPAPITVVDIIVNSEVHNTLEAAVLAAGLEGVLAGEGPFTVFAPTDAAFAALPAGTVEALLADIPTLTAILTYHVVGAAAFSGDLSDGQVIATLNGADVTVSLDGGVFINDAQVILADIAASNGVVHVIDAVLLPPAPITVLDIIVNSEVHNTLEVAVLAAGLDDELSGDGPFTVFAPTDAAFAALPAGTIEALLADAGALTNILLYHVVGAAALSTDLSDGQSIETLQGQDVVVGIDMMTVTINDATVIVADLVADNGVVHVIDAVLLPGTGVEAVNPIADFNVYPNPASFQVNIVGEVPAGANLNIYDAVGRSVYTSTFTGVANIDVSNFSKGVYTMMVVAEGAIRVKQFMVK